MKNNEREVTITIKGLDEYETSFIKKMQTKITDRIGVIVELNKK